MIESPLLDELKAEWKAEAKAEFILRILQLRFQTVPPDVDAAVREVRDERRLGALLDSAERSADLDAFKDTLLS